MKLFSHSILLIILLAITFPSFAQKKEKIKYKASGSLESGRKNGVKFQKLIDDVEFQQKETRIFGDSAYFYKKNNIVEVYGSVKILEGDSITITGTYLHYNGNTKRAKIRKDVIYKDQTVMLYTDFLDYNLKNRSANYFNNGFLVDSSNTLSSQKGYYNSRDKTMSFKGDVILSNPERKIYTDTLLYLTHTRTAIFKGPTKVVGNDGTVLNADAGGRYNASAEETSFLKAEIETSQYIITGDKLYYNEKNQYYTATNNVKVRSKKNNLIIHGGKAEVNKKTGITKIYNHPLLIKPMDGQKDTLFLVADTLISYTDSLKSKELLYAYYQVEIYKSDFQGKADSMVYHLSDSIIYFYKDPVLWSNNTQLLADSISLSISNEQFDKMNLYSSGFIITEDTLSNFNQIKGRNILVQFEQNELHQINVYGNGECIYFALEGDSLTMGMNKVECSDMTINFIDGEIYDFIAYNKPQAKFVPPHEFEDPDKKLKDFNWREAEKPKKNQKR